MNKIAVDSGWISSHAPSIPVQENVQATRASLLIQLRDAQNAAAWEEFVRVYTPIIYGFCRKQHFQGRPLQEADAGDITQEVMRAVGRAMGKFEYDPQRGKFRNWLLTVTRSKLNNFFTSRQQQHEPRSHTSIQDLMDAHPTPAEESCWDAEYHGRLFQWAAEELRPAIQEKTWQAFWRTTIEEQDPTKVAADLAVSVGSVYVAKSRVLARLKEKIQSIDEDAVPVFRVR